MKRLTLCLALFCLVVAGPVYARIFYDGHEIFTAAATTGGGATTSSWAGVMANGNVPGINLNMDGFSLTNSAALVSTNVTASNVTALTMAVTNADIRVLSAESLGRDLDASGFIVTNLQSLYATNAAIENLLQNLNLAGNTVSNGTFQGDGSGLTNLFVAQKNIIYVGKHGDATGPGDSIENAIVEVDLAIFLIEAASIAADKSATNRYVIRVVDDGLYNAATFGDFTLPEFIDLDAPNAILSGPIIISNNNVRVRELNNDFATAANIVDVRGASTNYFSADILRATGIVDIVHNAATADLFIEIGNLFGDEGTALDNAGEMRGHVDRINLSDVKAAGIDPRAINVLGGGSFYCSINSIHMASNTIAIEAAVNAEVFLKVDEVKAGVLGQVSTNAHAVIQCNSVDATNNFLAFGSESGEIAPYADLINWRSLTKSDAYLFYIGTNTVADGVVAWIDNDGDAWFKGDLISGTHVSLLSNAHNVGSTSNWWREAFVKTGLFETVFFGTGTLDQVSLQTLINAANSGETSTLASVMSRGNIASASLELAGNFIESDATDLLMQNAPFPGIAPPYLLMYGSNTVLSPSEAGSFLIVTHPNASDDQFISLQDNDGESRVKYFTGLYYWEFGESSAADVSISNAATISSQTNIVGTSFVTQASINQWNAGETSTVFDTLSRGQDAGGLTLTNLDLISAVTGIFEVNTIFLGTNSFKGSDLQTFKNDALLTNVSDYGNDLGYVTNGGVGASTNLSDYNNDVGFLTNVTTSAETSTFQNVSERGGTTTEDIKIDVGRLDVNGRTRLFYDSSVGPGSDTLTIEHGFSPTGNLTAIYWRLFNTNVNRLVGVLQEGGGAATNMQFFIEGLLDFQTTNSIFESPLEVKNSISISVGGNITVSNIEVLLEGEAPSSTDFTNHALNASAHHIKYTDAEATGAVAGVGYVLTETDPVHTNFLVNDWLQHTNIFETHTNAASAHHVKYTDAEATSVVAAVGYILTETDPVHTNFLVADWLNHTNGASVHHAAPSLVALSNAVTDAQASADNNSNNIITLQASFVALSNQVQTLTNGFNRKTFVVHNSDVAPAKAVTGGWETWDYRDAQDVYTWLHDSWPTNGDTAVNPTINLRYKVNQIGAATGSVEWVLTTSFVGEDELTTNTIVDVQTNVIAINNNVAHSAGSFQFTLDASTLTLNDIIQMQLQRTGSAVLDTFTGDIGVVEEAELIYRKK